MMMPKERLTKQKEAIAKILEGEEHIDLTPQNQKIRKLQHELIEPTQFWQGPKRWRRRRAAPQNRPVGKDFEKKCKLKLKHIYITIIIRPKLLWPATGGDNGMKTCLKSFLFLFPKKKRKKEKDNKFFKLCSNRHFM